jgi:hypothetical protein
MTLRSGILELAVCMVVIALSVVGTISAFVTDLQRDIDGLLLILVCALMGGLFSITLLLLAKSHGWLPHLSRSPLRKSVAVEARLTGLLAKSRAAKAEHLMQEQ